MITSLLPDRRVRSRLLLGAAGSIAVLGLVLLGFARAHAAGGTPVVTGLSAPSANQCSGSSIGISGSNFTGANLPGGSVKFGSLPAASFTVDSDTHITAVEPHGDAGLTVDVTVTVAGFGTSATSAADEFTFVAQSPTVTSVSPGRGPTAGGTAITITGTCFVDTTNIKEVDLGSNVVAQGSLGTVTDTTIALTTPSNGAAATVGVTVVNAGTLSSNAGSFTYVVKPTVSGTSPSSGPTSGATAVVVTGTGFHGGTASCNVKAISFGGTAATVPPICGDTSLTVVSPAHAAGTVDVVVTTDGGASSAVAGDHFSYVLSPTVSAVSPSRDKPAGGTTITVTGTGFFGGTGSCQVTGVLFGSTAGTGAACVSDTSLTVTDPAEPAGTVDVVVTTTGGGSSATSPADHFTYVAAPAVTSVSPGAGPLAGGTSVTVSGTGFFGGTTSCDVTLADVKFGATAGTGSIGSCSDTSFTVTSPAEPAGTVDVTVTNGLGQTSADNAGDHFTYAAAPTVTSIAPTAGPTAGGTAVVVTGTNFFVNGACGVTAVTWGGTAGTGLTGCSATSVTATSPAGSAGPADVQVHTAGGTSTAVAGDVFHYAPVPTVTNRAPTGGTTAGGTTVTVTGTGFDDGIGSGCHVTAVHFGSVAADLSTIAACTGGTTFTISSPRQPQGTVDITVTTDGGTSATSGADTYGYSAPAPAVTSVSPTRGPQGGGTSVTITGTGFTGTTGVTFGGTAATDLVENSDTSVTATSPAAGAAGTVDVKVTTAGGTSAAVAGDHFRYVAAPTVTGVAPGRGPMEGGTSVAVTGTGFFAGTGTCQVSSVHFGGSSVGAVSSCSDTGFTVVSPQEAAGTVDITVSNDLGQTSAANSPADQFAFIADPAVTGITPARGLPGGGTVVTVSGTGFFAGTGSCKVSAVSFGGGAGTGLGSCSDVSLDITSPAGSSGMTVDVTVTNDLGQTSTPVAADQFTYVAAPAVTGVSPPHGDPAGGTSVTVTGTGFFAGTNGCAVAAVSFGGTAATPPASCSDTSLLVTSPAGTDGTTIDITVTNDLGQTSTVNAPADQFSYVTSPVISGLTPAVGPYTGGTAVTITGTGFHGDTGSCNISSITFGGVAALVPVACGDASAATTAPAQSGPGAVMVVVTTTNGGASNSFTFTYQVTYSFAWYDHTSDPGFKSDSIHVANPAGPLAPGDVTVAIPNCASPTVNHIDPDELIYSCPFGQGFGGPVTVTSAERLDVSQRVRYYNTFNEVPAAESSTAGENWQFAWYDHASSAGFAGDNIHVWNPSGALSPAQVTSLSIPGCASPSQIQPTASELIYSCPFGQGFGGPVTLTTSVPVLASQRVHYYQSFNEVLGQAPSSGAMGLQFAWYDHASNAGITGDNIHIWDPEGGALSAADLTVTIPGCASPAHSQAGASELIYSCPIGSGFGGPATITSSTVPVLASQRVQYYQSFNEVPGVSTAKAATSLAFVWYDHTSDPGFVSDNLHVWNPSGPLSASELSVTIPGCASPSHNQASASELIYSCPFGSGFGGPVTITVTGGGVSVLASQRVQYYQSFNEVLAFS